MNAILIRRWVRRAAGVTLAALALLAVRGAQAQGVQGEIVKSGTGQTLRGLIAWRPGNQQYEIRSGDGGQAIVPVSQVASVRAARPAALDGALKAVRDGQTSGAPVDTLTKIVNDYLMIEHDLPAMRGLAEAAGKRGDAKSVVGLFDKVMVNRPPAMVPADVMRSYWDVLLAADRQNDLRKQLNWAIEQGPRPMAANAQVLRGNLDLDRKQYKDALVNGFLRTVVLFQDVREVQPEALFQAARCFEELGESGNAEKMRKKLLADYPDSSYSRRLNTGG